MADQKGKEGTTFSGSRADTVIHGGKRYVRFQFGERISYQTMDKQNVPESVWSQWEKGGDAPAPKKRRSEPQESSAPQKHKQGDPIVPNGTVTFGDSLAFEMSIDNPELGNVAIRGRGLLDANNLVPDPKFIPADSKAVIASWGWNDIVGANADLEAYKKLSIAKLAEIRAQIGPDKPIVLMGLEIAPDVAAKHGEMVTSHKDKKTGVTITSYYGNEVEIAKVNEALAAAAKEAGATFVMPTVGRNGSDPHYDHMHGKGYKKLYAQVDPFHEAQAPNRTLGDRVSDIAHDASQVLAGAAGDLSRVTSQALHGATHGVAHIFSSDPVENAINFGVARFKARDGVIPPLSPEYHISPRLEAAIDHTVRKFEDNILELPNFSGKNDSRIAKGRFKNSHGEAIVVRAKDNETTHGGITKYDVNYFAAHGYLTLPEPPKGGWMKATLAEAERVQGEQMEKVIIGLHNKLTDEELVAFSKEVIAYNYSVKRGYDVFPESLRYNLTDMDLLKSDAPKWALVNALAHVSPAGTKIDGFELKKDGYTPTISFDSPKNQEEVKLRAYYQKPGFSKEMITAVNEQFKTPEGAKRFLTELNKARIEYHRRDAARGVVNGKNRAQYLAGWTARAEALIPGNPNAAPAIQDFYNATLSQPAPIISEQRYTEVALGQMPLELRALEEQALAQANKPEEKRQLAFTAIDPKEFHDVVIKATPVHSKDKEGRDVTTYTYALFTHSDIAPKSGPSNLELDRMSDKAQNAGSTYIVAVTDGKIQPSKDAKEQGLLIEGTDHIVAKMRQSMLTQLAANPDRAHLPIMLVTKDIGHYTAGDFRGTSALGVDETTAGAVKALVGSFYSREAGMLPAVLQGHPRIAGIINTAIKDNALPDFITYNMDVRRRASNEMPGMVQQEYNEILAQQGRKPEALLLSPMTMALHFDGTTTSKGETPEGWFIQFNEQGKEVALEMRDWTRNIGALPLRSFSSDGTNPTMPGILWHNPLGMQNDSKFTKNIYPVVLEEGLNTDNKRDRKAIIDIDVVLTQAATGTAGIVTYGLKKGISFDNSQAVIAAAHSVSLEPAPQQLMAFAPRAVEAKDAPFVALVDTPAPPAELQAFIGPLPSGPMLTNDIGLLPTVPLITCGQITLNEPSKEAAPLAPTAVSVVAPVETEPKSVVASVELKAPGKALTSYMPPMTDLWAKQDAIVAALDKAAQGHPGPDAMKAAQNALFMMGISKSEKASGKPDEATQQALHAFQQSLPPVVVGDKQYAMQDTGTLDPMTALSLKAMILTPRGTPAETFIHDYVKQAAPKDTALLVYARDVEKPAVAVAQTTPVKAPLMLADDMPTLSLTPNPTIMYRDPMFGGQPLETLMGLTPKSSTDMLTLSSASLVIPPVLAQEEKQPVAAPAIVQAEPAKEKAQPQVPTEPVVAPQAPMPAVIAQANTVILDTPDPAQFFAAEELQKYTGGAAPGVVPVSAVAVVNPEPAAPTKAATIPAPTLPAATVAVTTATQTTAPISAPQPTEAVLKAQTAPLPEPMVGKVAEPAEGPKNMVPNIFANVAELWAKAGKSVSGLTTLAEGKARKKYFERGDKNAPEIVAAQNVLIAAKMLKQERADSDFGPNTEKALREFQRKFEKPIEIDGKQYAVTADGHLGRITGRAMQAYVEAKGDTVLAYQILRQSISESPELKQALLVEATTVKDERTPEQVARALFAQNVADTSVAMAGGPSAQLSQMVRAMQKGGLET